ncbi:DMT family transporter [Myxococcus stipitatus]|uniref:EamA family transporter n=1 Tax=Myxococcus stipitatus TaxID=83455 RepID=UPI001F269676|nr:DMT family transporter [Myxococcus stipitatus]MCE9672697.1 DMT family transporter [Myxococcus stipitatus]
MSQEPRRPSPSPFAVPMLLAAMGSIQVGASIAKGLFPIVGAQGTTALRLIFSSLILLAFWRPWRHRLTRQEARAILVYGAALGVMNLTFYLALARIPLGIAVAIEFTGPLAVAILSSRRPIDFLWALLAIAGVLLILPLSGAAGALDWVGVFWALVAGTGWALYILFGQKAGASVHGGTAASLGMTVAALVVVPVGITHAGGALLNPSLLPPAIGIAILSSALPYSLEMFVLKKMPARTFGVLMSLEPAIGALAGLVFLGERLAVTQWVAVGLIIAASVGSTASSRKA